MIRVFLAAAFVGLPAAVGAMPITATYTCERGVEIPVVYAESGGDSIAVLHVEGRMITLVRETSGSGARYGWPSDGSHYVWWSKGDGATLLWHDGTVGEEVTLFAECVTKP